MNPDKAAYNRVHAEQTRKRRAEKNLVMVEIPREYRDWFKRYAIEDGCTLSAAINGALEMFMEDHGQ